jgi:septal ring factor EnvC (AmiA/AmiB activator)
VGPPEGTRPFAEARGRLPLPARGKVIRTWGEVDPLGFPARGLTVEIVAEAQVVAPYDGRVVFAGAFRSYGQLLIIAHGGGYHTLIAGLYRIDGQVGQWLLAGEPVGQASHGENGKSTLYVELRRNGEPINPLPWLAAR